VVVVAVLQQDLLAQTVLHLGQVLLVKETLVVTGPNTAVAEEAELEQVDNRVTKEEHGTTLVVMGVMV
jgi:hypothetical protein